MEHRATGWAKLLPHHLRGSLGLGVLLSFLDIWSLGELSLPQRRVARKLISALALRLLWGGPACYSGSSLLIRGKA